MDVGEDASPGGTQPPQPEDLPGDLPAAAADTAVAAAAATAVAPTADGAAAAVEPDKAASLVPAEAPPAGASAEAAAPKGGIAAAALVELLRARLERALVELGAARGQLATASLAEDPQPASFVFSSELEDHADVLQVPIAIEPSVAHHEAVADVEAQPGAVASPELAAEVLAMAASLDVPRPSLQAVKQGGSEQTLSGQVAGTEMVHHVAASSSAGGAIEAISSRRDAATDAMSDHGGSVAQKPKAAEGEKSTEDLETELSMAKALLLLNNVTLSMNFDSEDDRPVRTQQQVLKGNRHLIHLLITLKQKVTLLNQQYLLLRGDMLYLNHEMNVLRHWILQSFRMAMQHQSQEHTSLQTRFERLSKVLN